jgi:hypothetical protein
MTKSERDIFIQGYDKGKAAGISSEYLRIINLLTSLGVIRDSIIGDHWKVLYAEDGAIDITTRQLKGRNNAE